MQTFVVDASTDPKTVFWSPSNKIGKIRLIEVDNQSSNKITIQIQDYFTPSPSVENPKPSEDMIVRKIITVSAGQTYTEKIDDGIEILGICKVVASVSDSNCKITIGYDLE